MTKSGYTLSGQMLHQEINTRCKEDIVMNIYFLFEGNNNCYLDNDVPDKQNMEQQSLNVECLNARHPDVHNPDAWFAETQVLNLNVVFMKGVETIKKCYTPKKVAATTS